jgi:hypothetical protein
VCLWSGWGGIDQNVIPARCRRSSKKGCGGCGVTVFVLPALTAMRAMLDRINLGRERHASFASAERAKQNRKNSKFTCRTR